MNKDAYLIQRLGRSDLYNDFMQAFGAGTGLPLTLRPVNFWDLAHRSKPHENPLRLDRPEQPWLCSLLGDRATCR